VRAIFVELSFVPLSNRRINGLRHPERDRGAIEVLNEIVARKPRWGFWKLYDRLRLGDSTRQALALRDPPFCTITACS